MTDLDLKEQNFVRIALQHFRRRLGGWEPLSEALGFSPVTVEKVANMRGRSVTASMALRVARLAGVTVDDLLMGRFLPGACPKCGHMPDFADEPTTAGDDAPRPPTGSGLKLVR